MAELTKLIKHSRRRWRSSGHAASGADANMESTIRKRSIHIRGQKTSISLENEFWDAFREIAEAQDARPTDAINLIDRERSAGTNLSSAIRLFMLDYFRSRRRSGPE
jgi:predicted DNA-binding ribbon-helix-helix protein